jgi:ribosomal protein S6--L-glutamate ligase
LTDMGQESYNLCMKIAVLSRNEALYSTRRLVQSARSRGHHVKVIDTLAVAVEVGLSQPGQSGPKLITSGPLGLTRTGNIPEVDAIIPRIGASVTFYGLAVVRQFEALGVLTTAGASAIACSRDKLHSLQRMSRAGLPIPKTAVIAQPRGLFSAVHAVGGVPVVIKLIRGTQGRGVILAKNLATAAAVLEKVRKARRQALVQEYVAESNGRDTRIIVVGDNCIAAMQRIAVAGDFRANLHRGGTAITIIPDGPTSKLAVAAARAHGLAVAGVDLIHSERGPLLLEVNSSPGLEGIEGVTGVDIAQEIIVFLERLAMRQRP